jgi:hypothetical protein
VEDGYMKNLVPIFSTVALIFAVLFVLTALNQNSAGQPADEPVSSPNSPAENGRVIPIETSISTSAPTNVVLPTSTPGEPAEFFWTPTPITVEVLPSPEKDSGSAVGRILCSGTVAKQQVVYVIRVDGTSYLVAQIGYTDENGLWFAQNILPGTYIITTKPPKGPVRAASGTWEVGAGHLVNFGDIDFNPPMCNR